MSLPPWTAHGANTYQGALPPSSPLGYLNDMERVQYDP